MIWYFMLVPTVTTNPWRSKASRSLPLPPPVRHLLPRSLRKIKGEMWTIFYVASVSIPMLNEMDDEVENEVILP